MYPEVIVKPWSKNSFKCHFDDQGPGADEVENYRSNILISMMNGNYYFINNNDIL